MLDDDQVYVAVKRLMDASLAAGGILALAPLLVAIGVVVRLDSPGPALFRHERVGRRWQHFSMLKFRTMVADASRRGGSITVQGDQRITRVGRLLRAWKLDEFPQLINVLRGDMSLVGPRPEVAEFAERFRDDYEEILRARPGITDEASVEYRSEEEVLAAAEDPKRAYVEEVLPHKIALAKRYLARRSLRVDLEILLKTLARILRP